MSVLALLYIGLLSVILQYSLMTIAIGIPLMTLCFIVSR